MQIRKISENKKEYLELLLLADEQEEMIDRYLERGDMYILEEEPGGRTAGTASAGKLEAKAAALAVCVVTDEGSGMLEIKNLAVRPDVQKRGYGRFMIQFIEKTYRDRFQFLQVGTGDSPATLPFYEKCGFRKSHVIRNFYTEHYDHPIYECGRLLADMVYLKKEF